MKTDFAKALIVIARRILTSSHEGRFYAPETIEWARFIVETNA